MVDLALWRELVLKELCDVRLFCTMAGVEFGLDDLIPAVVSCSVECDFDERDAEAFIDRHDKIERASVPMHDPCSSWHDFVEAWGAVVVLELDSVIHFFSHQRPDESRQAVRDVQEVGVVLPGPADLPPRQSHCDHPPPRDGDSGAGWDVLPCLHAQLQLHG